MEFEWDQAKSDENLRSRGFDFAFAAQIFVGTCVESPDDRRDYRELRIVAIGFADGMLLSVVYTDRIRADGSAVRRIISARIAKREERFRYAEATQIR